MSDDDIRREDAVLDSDSVEVPSRPDSVISALRDIPRLRSIEEEAPGKVKKYSPPPPMVSRISGVMQGCGGLLLAVLGVIMLLAAFTYGFYLWGPGLILVGGIVLITGTIGVWRGRRVPVLASITALVVAIVIGYMWETFISIAGRLTPLGGIGMIIGPAASLIALVMIVSLVSNLFSLVYWKRLVPSTPRGIAVWVFGSLVLVVLVVVLHFTQQDQRKAWMADHYDQWRAEATADSLNLGSSLSVTLGYSFTTVDENDENYYEVHTAELDAVLDAGASVIRYNASGDMLLEAEEPVLFDVDQEDPDSVQQAQDRIDQQLVNEAAYMALLQDSGVDVLLVDYQYSPYLLMRSYDTEEKMPWVEFVAIQEARIRHYAELYQPAYYEIINEPSQYSEYSGIENPEGENVVDAWIAQTIRLANAVHEVSPDTKIGVSLALQQELDEDYYVLALEMEEIDFIGFRAFQPAAFEVIEDMMVDLGHPADYGKEAWIIETWFGACLAPQRSQELDGLWLEMTAAFAAKERFSTVLASDFGCFVNEGGTRIITDPDLGGRTDVWETWRDVIAEWQGS